MCLVFLGNGVLIVDKKSILRNEKLLPLFALIAELSWGFAFPLIKLGMIEFQISTENTGGKTLFAGIRFLIAGIVVLLFTRKRYKNSVSLKKKDWLLLLLFAVVNTTLHYFFFYIGMSNSYGSRASVLDSFGTFLLVLLACVFFKEEHLTWKKIVGCCFGVSGIILLNLQGLSGGHFQFMGDGMMLCNCLCASLGGILTRVVSKRNNILFATGVSLAIGGLLLCLLGVCLRGSIPGMTPKGIVILGLLIGVSAVSFSVYNQLIEFHSVGKVAIYNSLIPIFGVILSCLLLGEPFMWSYLLSGVLVSVGVAIVNRK